jgi:uncharacterized protein YeaO (DUF488 family)
MIQTKRVYEAPARADGRRYLVDRLWPRGVRKEALSLAGWCKAVAPSPALRKWFNHDPARWAEFERRYRAELDAHPENWRELLDLARKEKLTLLFGAHDINHNNAVVLKHYLEEHLQAREAGSRK